MKSPGMGGDLALSLGDGKKIRRLNFQMTYFRKKFHFNADNFWLFWSSTVFCLSFTSLCYQKFYIPYTTPFLTKNLYFGTKIPSCTFVGPNIFKHPISLLLQILGDECMGHPLLKFWGTVHSTTTSRPTVGGKMSWRRRPALLPPVP